MSTEVRSRVAFVIMPFAEEFLSIYEQLIRPGIEAAGFQVRRGDDLEQMRNILRDVIEGIAYSDIVVADLTGLNPNVLYEVGIAHGLRKPVIMITQDIDKLPFDLRSYRVISYSAHFSAAADLLANLESVSKAYFDSATQTVGSGPVSDFYAIETGEDGTRGQPGARRPPKREVEDRHWLQSILDSMKSMSDALGNFSDIPKNLKDIVDAGRMSVELASVPNKADEARENLKLRISQFAQQIEENREAASQYFDGLPDFFANNFMNIDEKDPTQKRMTISLIEVAQAMQKQSEDLRLSLIAPMSDFSTVDTRSGLVMHDDLLDVFVRAEVLSRLRAYVELATNIESFCGRLVRLLQGKISPLND
ncbi:nucleoside 2-deoxyribosyltransferase [Actinomycetospora aeridis]|uniref:Nucleoside 2-deoxyribosyltransferase n=1 Tax=Actinomycetospora aeridis TaxID=3129231 RepID=A0ABU8MZR3_9PSEU